MIGSRLPRVGARLTFKPGLSGQKSFTEPIIQPSIRVAPTAGGEYSLFWSMHRWPAELLRPSTEEDRCSDHCRGQEGARSESRDRAFIRVFNSWGSQTCTERTDACT